MCETAERIKEGTVEFLQNVDWGKVGIVSVATAAAIGVSMATGGVAVPVVSGIVGKLGVTGLAGTVLSGAGIGALSGAAGGGTYALTSGVLSEKPVDQIGADVGNGILGGAVAGGLTGGLLGGLSTLTSKVTNPVTQYVTNTVGETAVDTVVDAAQGGNITVEGIATNLLINTVVDGVSNKVTGSKAKVDTNKPSAGEVIRTPEIEIQFNRNPKHDADEFSRQLKNQQNGMNNLTVEDYIKNRGDYLANGRSTSGKATQKTVREEALENKIVELMSSGSVNTLNEAEINAKNWLATKAALHDPDQIAGGFTDHITGVGDLGVNSSIGAQWKTRIGSVDDVIDEIVRTTPYEELSKMYLNVKLKGASKNE